jgi:hypothetical protein
MFSRDKEADRQVREGFRQIALQNPEGSAGRIAALIELIHGTVELFAGLCEAPGSTMETLAEHTALPPVIVKSMELLLHDSHSAHLIRYFLEFS